MPVHGAELLTVRDLARELGMSEGTVRVYSEYFGAYLPGIGEGPSRRYWPEALEVLQFVSESARAGVQVGDVMALLAAHLSPGRPARAASQDSEQRGASNSEQATALDRGQVERALRALRADLRARSAPRLDDRAQAPQQPAPPSGTGGRRPARVLAWPLLALALVTAVAVMWPRLLERGAPVPASPGQGSPMPQEETARLPDGIRAAGGGVEATAQPYALPAPARTTIPPPATPPEASPTPLPTPSLQTAPARVLIDEDFADNWRRWPDSPGSTAWLAEDGYHLVSREPGQFLTVGAPLAEPVGDAVITATFRKVGGPPGGCGLIVRHRAPTSEGGVDPAGRFVALGVSDRGEVGAWRREGDRWVDLLPWTLSPAVRPAGATNELAVRAIGQQITLVVNGVPVASVLDLAPENGGVGLFATGDLNEVLVERFSVLAPT
jgi:DNA-binding transcriptional MerR regulator